MKQATDSHGNPVFLVCTDGALEYVAAEVTDRGMPIGQGVVVGPNALADAQAKVDRRAEWDRGPRMRIFALVEVTP